MTTPRRWFRVLYRALVIRFGLLIVIGALFGMQGVAAAGANTRPNIVLIMADDQGWGETGYNGHPTLQTPVLDDMARTGLRFDRFYAAAPVCSPTRTAVLTGRHPNRSGVFAPNYCTRPEEITIPSLLQAAGYRTGHFGKWHVGAVKVASPVNPARMGYDEYLAHDNFFEMDPPLSRNGADPDIISGESSDIVVAAAEKFVEQSIAAGRPFFTTLWFGSPHAPYRGLPEDVALYGQVEGDELRNRFAEITAMDRAIGRFREFLKKSGVRDNTLVWYTSDNGVTIEDIPEPQRKGLFNGNWRGHKGSLYEGGLRVPAIMEWPAVITKPRATSVACVSSDMFPTLLDLLALQSTDPDRPIDGISLRPLIVDDRLETRPGSIGFWKYAGGAEKANGRWMEAELTRGTTPTTRNPGIDFVNFRHPIARTSNFPGEAAWTGHRYKLFITGKGAAELYDLQDDPQERNDLATQRPDLVRSMSSELHDWQRSVERSLTGADY